LVINNGDDVDIDVDLPNIDLDGSSLRPVDQGIVLLPVFRPEQTGSELSDLSRV
jgi:hypothetical protein